MPPLVTGRVEVSSHLPIGSHFLCQLGIILGKQVHETQHQMLPSEMKAHCRINFFGAKTSPENYNEDLVMQRKLFHWVINTPKGPTTRGG